MSTDREGAIREEAERGGVFTAGDGQRSVRVPSWEDVTWLLAELAATREDENTIREAFLDFRHEAEREAEADREELAAVREELKRYDVFEGDPEAFIRGYTEMEAALEAAQEWIANDDGDGSQPSGGVLSTITAALAATGGQAHRPQESWRTQ